METRLPSQPYTVIYGMHPIVPHVLDELCSRDDPVVLVAPTRPPGAHADVVFIAGDMTDEAVIARSRPDLANRALIACIDEADTMVVAVTLHGIAPELKTYALTASRKVARALNELGVKHTLAAEELVGHTVAKSLETPEAGDLLLQLVETRGLRLEEMVVDDALDAKPLSSARSTDGTLVLGIAHDGKVDLGVGDDPTLSHRRPADRAAPGRANELNAGASETALATGWEPVHTPWSWSRERTRGVDGCASSDGHSAMRT